MIHSLENSSKIISGKMKVVEKPVEKPGYEEDTAVASMMESHLENGRDKHVMTSSTDPRYCHLWCQEVCRCSLGDCQRSEYKCSTETESDRDCS